MYKVIKGARYNTDTAKYLASWSAPYTVNDFKYFEETLYQKQEITSYMEKVTALLRIVSVSLTVGHTEKKSYR